MKVIREDNFDRETIDDKLIAENLSSCAAQRMADDLNDSEGGEGSPWFFKVVADDYKLKEWQP